LVETFKVDVSSISGFEISGCPIGACCAEFAGTSKFSKPVDCRAKLHFFFLLKTKII
jgi:hypothetical protein